MTQSNTPIDYKAKALELDQENRELRSQLNAILEAIPGSFYCKDINGFYTKSNDYSLKILGLKSEKEIIGKTDYDLFPKSEADQFRKADLEVIKTGRQVITEEYRITRHKKTLTQLSIKRPLRNKKGVIIGVIGNTIDITDLKNTQEDKFYKIIDTVPASIYWKDINGAYLGCNKYMLKMAGVRSLSDIVGKKDCEMPWKDIADELRTIDQHVTRNKKTLEVEEIPTLANGQIRVFLAQKHL